MNPNYVRPILSSFIFSGYVLDSHYPENKMNIAKIPVKLQYSHHLHMSESYLMNSVLHGIW